MSRIRMSIGILLNCAGVWALVSAYQVEPQTASQSDWTRLPPHPSYYVSQTVTVNFDSLAYVELYAGEYGEGGAYNLEVLTYPEGAPVASQDGGTYLRPHHWVCFDNLTVTHPDRIAKGKQLEFRFTRSGADSVEYYWQGENPYPWGNLRKGGMDGLGLDLCCRVYGIADSISTDWWGVNAHQVWHLENTARTSLGVVKSMGIPWARDGLGGWTWLTVNYEDVSMYYEMLNDSGFGKLRGHNKGLLTSAGCCVW